jgi:hypothetical protein
MMHVSLRLPILSHELLIVMTTCCSRYRRGDSDRVPASSSLGYIADSDDHDKQLSTKIIIGHDQLMHVVQMRVDEPPVAARSFLVGGDGY